MKTSNSNSDSSAAYPAYPTPPASPPPESDVFSASEAPGASAASHVRTGTEPTAQSRAIRAAGGPLNALVRARAKRPMSLSPSDSDEDIVLPTARQLRFSDSASSSSHAVKESMALHNAAPGHINHPMIGPSALNHSNPLADDSIDRLPDDLIFDHIVTPLPPQSLRSVASVSRKYRQWARQLTTGAFHPLPEQVIVKEILPGLRFFKDLANFSLVSRKCRQWANQRVSDDPYYAPPRFNTIFEVGRFIQARYDRSGVYEIAQLHRMVIGGSAPQIHIPTVLRLFQKNPHTRTLDDLITTGLLTPTQPQRQNQNQNVKLNTPQIRYLTSNRVMLALARGVVSPHLVALSRIFGQYFTRGALRPVGILKAFRDRRYDVVDQMIASGLFIKISDNGITPLHDAVVISNAETVQALLAHGATEIIHWRNTAGETALHLAIRLEKEAIAQILIAYGAAAHIVNHRGDTPLHYVMRPMRQGDLMMGLLRALLQAPYGRQVINLRNREGQTPVDLASVSPRSVEVVQLLRAMGAKTAAELNAEAQN